MKAANDNHGAAAPETIKSGRPCPVCGKPSTAEMRPFCSKRCSDVDLHRWLGGRYAIPAEDVDDPNGEDHAG